MTVLLDLQEFNKKMQKAIGKNLSIKQMKSIGQDASEIIRRRTRLGTGVTKNNAKQSLRQQHRHKKSYTAYRKRNARYLSKYTTPTKHNLTLTGQMLSSVNITYLRKGIVVIGPRGNRRRTKLDSGGLSNKQVARYVTNRYGYSFMGLTRIDRRKLVQSFTRRFKIGRI